jgi:hypothetical protein
MRRRGLLFVPLMAGLVATTVRAATSWALVSDAEFARDRAAAPPHPVLTRSLPVLGAPKIEVVRPNVEARVPRPFSFRIRFEPQDGTAIDLASFRAGYGWLDIDITARLLEHARLSADGLAADDIDAPSGEHRVTISIADSRHRVGSRVFRFQIA